MIPIRISGRGFQICFFFTPAWGNDPNFTNVFQLVNWVETTNYRLILCVETCHGVSTSQFVWDIMTTLQRGTRQNGCEQNSPTAGVRVQKSMIFLGGSFWPSCFFFLPCISSQQKTSQLLAKPSKSFPKKWLKWFKHVYIFFQHLLQILCLFWMLKWMINHTLFGRWLVLKDVALLCITWMICRNSEIEWFVLKLRSL